MQRRQWMRSTVAMLGAAVSASRRSFAGPGEEEFPDGPDDDYSPMPPLSPRIRPYASIPWDGKPMHAVAQSAGGRVAAAAEDEKVFKVWDAKDGRARYTSPVHTGRVYALAFDPHGSHIASAFATGRTGPGDRTDLASVRIADAANGRELRVLHAFGGYVKGLALTGDGLAVALDGDDVLRAWNTVDGSEAYTLTGPVNRRRGGGYEATQSGFGISANGRRAVSLSTDGPVSRDAAVERAVHPEHTVNLWDAESKTCRVLNAKAGPLRAVALSPSGSRVLIASTDQRIMAFDFVTGRNLFSFYPGPNLGGVGPYQLAFSPDGERFMLGKKDGVLRVYESEKARHVQTFRGPRTDIRAVACLPDRLRVVSGGCKEAGSKQYANGYVGLKYEPLWVWDALLR